MKFELNRYFSKSISFFFFLIPLFYLKCDLLNAENLYFEEMQIDSSTKTGKKKIIPDNPFEIVEMIRRYNSLNDATKPSDAIDDALDSFNVLEKK